MKLNLRFGLIFWAVQSAWILGEFAMGHSTLEVTLGYLKHMARTELSQEDMPQLKQ